MANVKKAVPFNRKRFEYLLNRSGRSKNQFAKLMFPDTKQPLRKLLKYQAAGEIPPEILMRFASILDCRPDYLDGSYSVTEKELQEEFGEHYQEFANRNYDPDGYDIGKYNEFRFEEKFNFENEALVQFLNNSENGLYQYYRDDTKGLVKYMTFDFHDLSINELFMLKAMIHSFVEEILINPRSKDWKEFIKTTERKHEKIEIGGHKNDSKEETEED